MSGKRTLREFDDDELVRGAPVTHVQSARPAVEEFGATPATVPVERPLVAAPTGPLIRVGLYFQPETFNLARSAYMADLDTLGAAAEDSFARWIARSMMEFAGQSTSARQQIVAQLDPVVSHGAGFTRSVFLPKAVLDARDVAIATDRRSGGHAWSRSGFSTDAIRHSIQQAAARNGGELPPPPSRLPNKPVLG